MLDTIIAALLPIIITLFLGLLAGWHKDFNLEQASLLNRMVMLYALPLSLFSSMVLISRHELLSDGWLFALIGVGMLGVFLLAFVVAWKVFKRDQGTAVLQALAIAGPAVPFVGVPVLGYLFGNQSVVAIAIGSIILNAIQVPVCMVVLSMHSAGEGSKASGVATHIRNAVKEPVVWAPFVALLFIMLDVRIPKALDDSLALLGKATGGVALFASGVVLFAQKVKFSKAVGVSVLCRNLIVPLAIMLLAMLFKVPEAQTTEAVLTMAIPTASIVVMLAVQFKVAEQEAASVLFVSTVFSVLTMALFIALTR